MNRLDLAARTSLVVALGVSSLGALAPADSPTATRKAWFVEVAEAAGLHYDHRIEDRDSNIGRIHGGVAAGDVDGDGWVDLYFVRGDAGGGVLMRNERDGTFVDVAGEMKLDRLGDRGGVDSAALSGPAFGDVDGNGRLDLLLGGIEGTGPRLLRLRGNGRYKDVTRRSRLEWHGNTLSAAFGDHDRDGDLDVFLAHWEPRCGLPCARGHLWENDGRGRFRDVDAEAGIDGYEEEDLTFTPNFADIDDDGWPDLLVAADFGTSRVFLNDGDGTFTDVTDREVITDENGMGAAVGDYDNDGDLDWFVSSITWPPERVGGIGGNRLYRNDGTGRFEDATDEAGVLRGGWGWGACFADFDNDADLDLFHVNGWDDEGYADDRSVLFRNRGGGKFVERSRRFGIDDTGQGRGVVCFDYDRDGDIDFLVSNSGGPPALYRNDRGNRRNYLVVRLRDDRPNVHGVGARIRVTAAGRTQVREMRMGSNFASQNPLEVHFGLRRARRVDEVRVRWPDGDETVLTDVDPNRLLLIERP